MNINLRNTLGKDTKQILLDASFKVFISKEYGQVTFDHLEKAVNYTKGVFFYYFKNKEALFSQMIDTYYFSRINLEHPICPPVIETFKGFLEHKVAHQEQIKKWFKQKGVEGNPAKIMQHLFAQAIMRYPNFRLKYISLTSERYSEWKKAIGIGKKMGEIPSNYDTENLAICLDSFFRVSPIANGNMVSYNQVNQFCANFGILKDLSFDRY